MDVLRMAAFTDGDTGGNPAGVLIAGAHPEEAQMRRIAAEVGYSETAFAAPDASGWRVRYFSPESEVPFCGHATLALGAALALAHGDGVFALQLNDAAITVEGRRDGTRLAAGRRIRGWSGRPWPCWATPPTIWTPGFRRPWPTAGRTTWCWRSGPGPCWPPWPTTWPPVGRSCGRPDW